MQIIFDLKLVINNISNYKEVIGKYRENYSNKYHEEIKIVIYLNKIEELMDETNEIVSEIITNQYKYLPFKTTKRWNEILTKSHKLKEEANEIINELSNNNQENLNR